MNPKIKKTLMLILKIVFSIGIIGYIFTKQVDFNQVYTCLKTAEYIYLILSGIIFLFLLFLGFFRWNILLKVQDIIIKKLKLIQVYCIGLFFNTFMVGLTGGDIIRIYYIAKLSENGFKAGTTVVVDRIAGVAGLISVVFIGILFAHNDPRFKLIFWPSVLSFIFMFLCFIIVLNKSILRSIPFFKSILNVIPFRDKIYEMYNIFYKYKSYKKQFITIVIISLLIHPSISMMNYYIAKSIGITGIPFYYYFILIPVICFISAMPISVAGWGVGEALYISLFGQFGVAPAQAVTLSILFKFYYIILGLFCGIAYAIPGLEIHEDNT